MRATLSKTAFVLGAVIVLGSVIFLFTSSRAPEMAEPIPALKDLGFTVSALEDFTITEEFGSTSVGDELHVALQREGDVVRMQINSGLSKEEAKRYSAGQYVLLESQYDTNLPPYPEFLTNRTGCTEKFLPQKRTAPSGEYYLVHGSDRFTYGLCSDDLVHYTAGFGIFYCEPKQKIFQIEYFISKNRPMSDVERFMNSFRCSPS